MNHLIKLASIFSKKAEESGGGTHDERSTAIALDDLNKEISKVIDAFYDGEVVLYKNSPSNDQKKMVHDILGKVVEWERNPHKGR